MYQIFKIKKKPDSYRVIYAPVDYYKKFLKGVIPTLKAIYDENVIYDCDHAFLSGRSCITNAKEHIGNRFVLSLDIEDFFDSIRIENIQKYFPDQKLLDFILVDKRVVQGFPTSPYLANISMIDADFRITMFLKKMDLKAKYTRYADDLYISFSKKEDGKQVIEVVSSILKELGFRLNDSKTTIYDKEKGRAIITGIGVSMEKIYPTRRTLKKIRASIHQENTRSYLGLRAWRNYILKNAD